MQKRTAPLDVLKECTGLNTVKDPTTLDPSEIASSKNVVISASNRVQLCTGYTTLQSLTSGHSLFCNGGDCLVSDGTTLYRVLPDTANTLVELKTGLSGARLDHTQNGTAIYYSNRFENGVYEDGAVYDWDVDEYNGPTTALVFEAAVPKFDHIANFNGFMLGAIGNALFCSEWAQFGLWRMRALDAGLFPSKIVMIKPVDGGVFVSDERATYFLSGEVPEDFRQNTVANYPAIEWAGNHENKPVEKLVAQELGTQELGACAFWLSQKGLCIGTPSGRFKNLTEAKIKYPGNGVSGASLIRGYQCISTMR